MRTVVAIVIFALPGLASACDLKIEGKWRSEKAETMRFNREYARLQPKADSFLDALMGNMTLEFGDGEIQLRMPDLNVPVNGSPVAFAGFEERKPYTLLLCNDLGVVISSPETGSGRMLATTYYFVGPDLFWVYAGSNDPKMPDLHIREYFRRVR